MSRARLFGWDRDGASGQFRDHLIVPPELAEADQLGLGRVR